jgi:hypothetical protein
MDSVIIAHLNGGPRDDEMQVMAHDRWHVPVMSYRHWSDPADTYEPSSHYGTYVMRRDFLGDPVIHNLEGAIEYDWQM